MFWERRNHFSELCSNTSPLPVTRWASSYFSMFLDPSHKLPLYLSTEFFPFLYSLDMFQEPSLSRVIGVLIQKLSSG